MGEDKGSYENHVTSWDDRGTVTEVKNSLAKDSEINQEFNLLEKELARLSELAAQLITSIDNVLAPEPESTEKSQAGRPIENIPDSEMGRRIKSNRLDITDISNRIKRTTQQVRI